MSGLNARLSPAPLPLLNALQRSSARCTTEALQGTSPLVREAFVATRPVARVLEKMFLSDYPRGLANCFWRWRFPALDPFPVARALAVAFPLAAGCSPVLLLCLPPRPLPRRLAAACAAIVLARPLWAKHMLATFQQTTPGPRSTALPPASRLPFARTCRTLGRSHGSDGSQKLLPWRGMLLLSRAQ